MTYTLMHKKIPVARLDIDPASGSITRIYETLSIEHLPVGVRCKNGVPERASLNGWWRDRSIPLFRQNIARLLNALKERSPHALPLQCCGFSLTDQYWLQPEDDASVTWETHNFFQNEFSSYVGDVLFGTENNAVQDGFSPDNTTDGCLQKRWIIRDGKRYLLKGGEPPYYQHPFNEVIASLIMERLGIPHVPYFLEWHQGHPYSLCEGFVTADTELIPAWRVLQIRPKANHENEYLHYINTCKELGINITDALDRMIVLDYLILNEDRHFNNFGLLRNAETLEWIGAAPIYDSGTSLGYRSEFPNVRAICKPFRTNHEEQLRLVTSLDWFDFEKLEGIPDEISAVLSDDPAKNVLGKTRHQDITGFVRQRIERLKEITGCKKE